MALIGNFVILALWLMGLAMMLRFLIRFVDPSGQSALSAFFARVTEPIYAPIRRLIPPMGIIDPSPLVAILLLFILQMIFRAVWPA